jgi:hypothetical protein
MIAVAACAVLLAGCEIVTIHDAHWRAELDTMPAADCVAAAVARVPGARVLTGNKAMEDIRAREPAGVGFVPVAVDYIGPEQPTMSIRVTQKDGHRAFELGYIDSERFRAQNEAMARALVASVASVCGVPELEQWVHIDKDSDSSIRIWAPV